MNMRILTFNEIQVATGGQGASGYQCLCIEASRTRGCASKVSLGDAIEKCCFPNSATGGSQSFKYIVSTVNEVFSGTCTNT